MRYFSHVSPLRGSSLALRVTLSWFLLFVAIGTATNLAMLAWKTGFTAEGVARHYRGYEPLPESTEEFRYPKEFRELVENAHFHVYAAPVVILILAHLLLLTGWSQAGKLIVTSLLYGSTLAELAAPWLVRYGGEGFAWWKLLSSAVFHGSVVFALAVLAAELWWPGDGPRSGGDEPADAQPG